MNDSTLHISICQFKILNDKMLNLERAKLQIEKAVKGNANIVVLPECFVCPYDIKIFVDNSEPIDDLFDNDKSPATCMLRESSLQYPDVYIVGGSIIESDFNKKLNKTLYYNTCLVFYQGKIIGKYRKINLYKIDIKEHSFCEADILSSGDLPVIVNTKYGNIGIGICYDLRFGELAKFYQENGCNIIFYPGSFNRFTGPKHWKVLQQVRALDNQLFVVSCSSACSFDSEYESYGKSFIISPWGRVLVETELDKEEIKTAILNLDEINSVRKNLPILF